MAKSISLYDALKRMRRLTDLGIPFSFTFLSYNETKRESNGFKTVTKAQLRQGYRDDQSEKADVLIGYVNESGKNRWFYLPLLIKFNGYTVKP